MVIYSESLASVRVREDTCGSSSSRWIIRPEPHPFASLRLFCFPYAGGGSMVYRSWPQDLPDQVEVCCVQPPGRENRLAESPFTCLSLLVQTLADELYPFFDRPFAFFGHSLGALVSFEVIRLMRDRFGLNPVHLFISGYRAPHLPNPDLPVHQLPCDEFEMQLRRLHGTPEEVLQDKELMQIMIPLLRADFAVHETYSYLLSAPLDCPISAFGGWNDEHASYEELDLWRQHTQNYFNLQMFDGDHFFLRNARSNLLNSLSQELAQFL